MRRNYHAVAITVKFLRWLSLCGSLRFLSPASSAKAKPATQTRKAQLRFGKLWDGHGKWDQP